MKKSLLLLAAIPVGISCNKEPQFVTHENTTVEGVLLSAADRSPIANGKMLLLSSYHDGYAVERLDAFQALWVLKKTRYVHAVARLMCSSMYCGNRKRPILLLRNPHQLTGRIAKNARVEPRIECKFNLYLLREIFSEQSFLAIQTFYDK